MKILNNLISIYIIPLTLAFALNGCIKEYVPTEVDSFSKDMNFVQKEFKPILGRAFSVNTFNDDLSKRPLTFRIVNLRTFDDKPAPELTKPFPVLAWKRPYTGLEKSLEEINNKREIVMRPLWDIGLHSGIFTMWDNSSSDFILTEPDSCYIFDVEVSNSGGTKYFQNFKLKPQKEVPALSGPGNFLNVIGDSTKTFINDAKYWLNRLGDGNSISFKFIDKDLKPIKLSKFNAMSQEDWKNLVHGFNMRFSSDSTTVTYDIAYPVPLVPTLDTRYNTGTFASSEFKYNRLKFGGTRESSSIKIHYNIYQKGSWEVVTYFPSEAPKFDND